MTTNPAELRRINITVPAGLHKRARIAAIEQGTNFSGLLRELLVWHLDGARPVSLRPSGRRANRRAA